MNSPKNPETKKTAKKPDKIRKRNTKTKPGEKNKCKKQMPNTENPIRRPNTSKIIRPLAKNSPFPRKWCKDNTNFPYPPNFFISFFLQILPTKLQNSNIQLFI